MQSGRLHMHKKKSATVFWVTLAGWDLGVAIVILLVGNLKQVDLYR